MSIINNTITLKRKLKCPDFLFLSFYLIEGKTYIQVHELLKWNALFVGCNCGRILVCREYILLLSLVLENTTKTKKNFSNKEITNQPDSHDLYLT